MKTKEEIIASTIDESVDYVKRRLTDEGNYKIISVKEAFNIAEIYAEQVRPKWTSLNDELPIDEGEVLILGIDKSVQLAHYDIDGDTNKFLTEDEYEIDMSFCTHWMPLPQIPAEAK